MSTLFYPSKPNNICCHLNCFDNTYVDTTTQGFHTRDHLWLHSDTISKVHVYIMAVRMQFKTT